jgi:hypothetical protein
VQERTEETTPKNEVAIGPTKLTRYERARIVGARALQIAMGAPILVESPETRVGPIDIALSPSDELSLMGHTKTYHSNGYEDNFFSSVIIFKHISVFERMRALLLRTS